MYEQEGYTFERWNFNPLQVLGVMIGGDYFGNNEGLLPSGDYKECDVDYHDSSRGTKRLVYTNAGIVHYTANHYETFTLIYE
jgi:guanyl-specific ribonuclease Sa